MHFHIFYKKLHIEWCLTSFNREEVNNITKKILKTAKSTKNICHGVLHCNRKTDLNKIYKILYSEYYEIKKRNADIPDILYQKCMNFINDNDIWQNYD